MVIEVGQRIAGGTTCNAVWLSDMLGTWSFKPVLTGGTVVCCRESDRLLEIWTEISFAMAIQAVWRVADGVCAIRAVTIDFSDLACLLRSFRGKTSGRQRERRGDIPPGSAAVEVSERRRGVDGKRWPYPATILGALARRKRKRIG